MCGCSFSSFSSGRNETLGSGEEESDVSGATRPGASGTRGVADGGDEEEESGSPPPTSGATLPPGDDADAGRVDLGTAQPTSGADEGMTGDCVGSTFDLGIDDATVIEPMQMIDVDGVGLAAFSSERDAGDVEFSFDVDCPGTYYLHAYVADLWAGVHYDDPDSYDVYWPGGEGSWYYGCQTAGTFDGWHWLQVFTGVQGEPCDTATPVVIELAAGTNVVRLRNREEEVYWGGVAAIARLVVTDDPGYAPM